MHLDFPNGSLDLGQTRVMGILNVTPDSFSDGGLYAAHNLAIEHALQMIAEGADIIDIGGESTRPGAVDVSAAEELDRVLGVIEGIRKLSPLPISIDTSKPEVMRAAVAAGASMVNDVRGLSLPGALDEVAALQVPVCLMHMQGEPGSMQRNPVYADVVANVTDFLLARVAACEAAGIGRQQLVIDPGFGFGKTLEHNLRLLTQLHTLVARGLPVLAGLSRKSMIPAIMENAGLSLGALEPAVTAARGRLAGSVTLALYAAAQGAHIVRVHDVRETVEALTIQRALLS
jgi:dihydropteroate synthase